MTFNVLINDPFLAQIIISDLEKRKKRNTYMQKIIFNIKLWTGIEHKKAKGKGLAF